MKYTELKNSIAEGAKPVYLLEGEDAYFRMKGEEQIKDAFLEMLELNFTVFDGETLKGGAITSLVSAVKNYPFMAERRIVKVTEFYPSESDYEKYLKPLFENFPPSSILMIINTGAKKGVDLKRKHAVTFVDCSKADSETVARWVYITLKRANISISAYSSEKIAEYCLCNMSRVAVEVDKIIAYKGVGAITQEEIEELVYKDADYRLYELTNAASRRDYTKFCTIASELLDKSGDEIYILSGLFSYFKNLHMILLSRDNNAALAEMLKMKEYSVKKMREQGEAMGEKKLARLIEYLYAAISDVKCGRKTPKTAFACAENAIFFSNGNN